MQQLKAEHLAALNLVLKKGPDIPGRIIEISESLITSLQTARDVLTMGKDKVEITDMITGLIQLRDTMKDPGPIVVGSILGPPITIKKRTGPPSPEADKLEAMIWDWFQSNPGRHDQEAIRQALNIPKGSRSFETALRRLTKDRLETNGHVGVLTMYWLRKEK